MDSKEKENDIEKLTQIYSALQNLYYKRKEQLEALQQELSELREMLNVLNSLISTKSFQSADEFYVKSLKTKEEILNHVEDYFKEEIPKESVKGTKLKSKIFSQDNEKEGELLCVLDFLDFNRVEIKFLNPEASSVKETDEQFINIFLREALIKIKEKNPELTVNYNYYKNSDLIEQIHILNLSSMNDFDLITSKIRALLIGDSDNTIKPEGA